MRHEDESMLARAFAQRLNACDNPRLKEVLTTLVDHLHRFAREVNLTESEWMTGIQFLTRTGQMCSDTRQEFILLSDVLALSMLVTAMSHPKPPGCTEGTVLGPFHTDDAPRAAQGADITRGAPGTPLDVEVALRTIDGAVVAGADVDVWQADDDGKYDVQHPDLTERRARALLRSDPEGRVRFATIVPTAYPVPTDGPVGQLLVATGRHPWRPAHLHFLIKAEGCETLVTHLFREGDPYLDSDVVFGVRNSLIVPMPPNPDKPGRHQLRHTFVLNPVHKA